MGRVILTLPRLGETMEEAKVTEWLVVIGDSGLQLFFARAGRRHSAETACGPRRHG